MPPTPPRPTTLTVAPSAMSGCSTRSRGSRWLSVIVVSLWWIGLSVPPVVVAVGPAVVLNAGSSSVARAAGVAGGRAPPTTVTRIGTPSLCLHLHLVDPHLWHPAPPPAVLVEHISRVDLEPGSVHD